MPPADVINLQHVSVVRGGRQVLNDIQLSVTAGEQIAILGPNGCGKSTLLKAITGELYPIVQPETRITRFGQERWNLADLRQRLGVVEQDLPGRATLAISGRDAILTGFFSSSCLWPHLVVTAQMRAKADAMLERIDALDLVDRPVGEMSAGQQRRILIGRSLVASAGCLLLDEPSNGLDLAAQRTLRNLLMTLAAEGTTILHVTHHVADIIPAMQRIVLMKEGRIVADDTREVLLTSPVLRDLFGCNVQVSEGEGFLHAW